MCADLMEPLEPVGAAARCPGCGSHHTTWVRAGTQDNLLCKTCGTCWHTAAGHGEQAGLAALPERVRPQDCPGCQFHGLCVAAQGLVAS